MKKPEIEYSNLRITHRNNHKSLRQQGHSYALSKKSDADFNPAKSIIREATKWPNGHKQDRARARNLNKLRRLKLLEKKDTTLSQP